MTCIFTRENQIETRTMSKQVLIAVVVAVATIASVSTTSVEEVLAGLSTPDLNNLLKDLDYDSALNNLEYGEAPEYFLPASVEQKIRERAESVVRPVEGDPLFDRPKGVIANQVEENGKAKAVPAAAHQAPQAPEANMAAASMLPAYCDPPNPCPLGYTSQDGCIEDFENSSEFSRIYQSRQKCICDTEHMFNCPDASNDADEDNEIDNEPPHMMASLPASGFGNPYLSGQKLPVAAKKGMDF
jgi:hypothetical protein